MWTVTIAVCGFLHTISAQVHDKSYFSLNANSGQCAQYIGIYTIVDPATMAFCGDGISGPGFYYAGRKLHQLFDPLSQFDAPIFIYEDGVEVNIDGDISPGSKHVRLVLANASSIDCVNVDVDPKGYLLTSKQPYIVFNFADWTTDIHGGDQMLVDQNDNAYEVRICDEYNISYIFFHIATNNIICCAIYCLKTKMSNSYIKLIECGIKLMMTMTMTQMIILMKL